MVNTSNKKLIPMPSYVIAQQLPGEEKQKGIIVPNSLDQHEMSRVISVGTESQKLIKTGDMILTTKFSGQKTTLGGEEYIIFKSEDVIAILT